MAAIASMTVKKFDGTTDIVFDSMAGSGGDGSPAVYRQDTGAPAALPVGLRPLIKLWTSWNGPKTARVLKASMAFPYAVQDSTTTLYSSKDRIVVDLHMTIPQGLPATFINEGVHQALNCLAHSQVKSSGTAGFAPT